MRLAQAHHVNRCANTALVLKWPRWIVGSQLLRAYFLVWAHVIHVPHCAQQLTTALLSQKNKINNGSKFSRKESYGSKKEIINYVPEID